MGYLAQLSPFGPIFAKEIRAMSRRRRNHVLRVVYLGILLLLLTAAYSASGGYRADSVTGRIEAQARLGAGFFYTFAFFCLTTMALIGPVLTSTAIGGEKLAKTLPVLLMTPLNTWQILGGKLFARLLQALLLLGLSLPVLAVVRLLGGVELWQMGAAIAICLATALFAASVGLVFSTVMTRAYGAILLSYAVLLGLYLVVPLLVTVYAIAPAAGRPGGGPAGVPWAVMSSASPFVAMTMAVFAPGWTTAGPSLAWWPCVATQVAGAGAMLLVSAGLLRRYQRREASAGGADAAPAAADISVTPGQAESPRLSPAPAVERPWVSAGNHPVAWRELRRPMFARRWQTVLAVLFVAGLMGGSYALLAWDDGLDAEVTQVGFAWLFGTAWWVLVAVLSATTIAQEKEGDTWTLLLATPLTAGAIVLGKLAGTAKRMWLPLLAMLIHLSIFAMAGVISWTSAGVVVFVTVTFSLPWMATGTYLSLRLSKVTTAVVVNLLLPLGLYLGAPLVESLARDLLDLRSSEPVSLVLLPYFYPAEAITELEPNYALAERPDLPGNLGHRDVWGWCGFVAMLGLAHLAAGGLITGWTIVRFDRIVGRATGPISAPPPAPPRPTS